MSRILLTDDSSAQRLFLSGILKKFGYEVETAVNGQDALEKIEANRPDCMLLDNLIPIMDGLQTLEALQKPETAPYPSSCSRPTYKNG